MVPPVDRAASAPNPAAWLAHSSSLRLSGETGLTPGQDLDDRLSPVVALHRVPVIVEHLRPAILLGPEGVGLGLALPDDDRRVDAGFRIGEQVEADEARGALQLREV